MNATIRTQACNRCGAPLANNPAEGLCPRCLLSQAINPESTPDSEIEPTALMSEGGPTPVAAGPLLVRYFGDYELQGEIARGGMGVVYRARQISLNRPVALKMILAGQLATEADVKRFRVEAEAAANLRHPNIVAIHEIGEHEGRHFFSMDFVEGQTLAQCLNTGPLAVGEAVQILKTLAQAVHFAHERGVLHRDLKPGNVLLDKSGQPHLMDFGLAKRRYREEQLTLSGTAMGTPAYSAPEQLAGRSDLTCPASDLYSLGAILYHMLTGEAPFRGRTLSETLALVLEQVPKSPSELNPRVPRDLETIALKCLEKRPDQRYQSAGELADDLDRFLNHEPILAHRPGSITRLGRSFVSGPRALSLVAFVGLIGLLWFGFSMSAENRILRWEKEFPDIIKAAPFFVSPDGDASPLTVLTLFAIGVIGGFVSLLRKRVHQRVLTGRFCSPRLLAALVTAAYAGMLAGILFGFGQIEIFEWSRHAIPLVTKKSASASQNKIGLGSHAKNADVLAGRDPISLAEAQLAGRGWPEMAAVFSARKNARIGSLVRGLLLSSFLILISANLAVKAIRERRFTFYFTLGEEQFQRSVAAIDEKMEQEEGILRFFRVRRLGFVLGAVFMLLPNLYWATSTNSLGAGPFVAETVTTLLTFGLSRVAVTAFSRRGRGALWLTSAILFGTTILIGKQALQDLLPIGLGLFVGTTLGLLFWSGQKMARQNTLAKQSA